MSLILLVAAVIAAVAQPIELEVRFTGNGGVLLSDGVTSVLVDVPYQSGAFGYMEYAIDSVQPVGRMRCAHRRCPCARASPFHSAVVVSLQPWRDR